MIYIEVIHSQREEVTTWEIDMTFRQLAERLSRGGSWFLVKRPGETAPTAVNLGLAQQVREVADLRPT